MPVEPSTPSHFFLSRIFSFRPSTLHLLYGKQGNDNLLAQALGPLLEELKKLGGSNEE
jgi:hypothetical protein